MKINKSIFLKFFWLGHPIRTKNHRKMLNKIHFICVYKIFFVILPPI